MVQGLTGYLLSIVFIKTKSDALLLVRQGIDETKFVLLYVNDIIVTGRNTFIVVHVIASLSSQLSIKDF